jgi:N-acetylmuramoyl-L-alanine amidase
MVVDLAGPMLIGTAGMETDPVEGAARITVVLHAAGMDEFLEYAGEPPGVRGGEAGSGEALPAMIRQTGERPLVVVLDPGHGGIDPGAEQGGAVEARLMLGFARELKEELRRSGRFEVVMTRDSDEFVPLETRVSIARAVGADVFLSLHADVVDRGVATGATVYTLSQEASEEAAGLLAARHSRADLLAGVDLTGQDDVVAGILMDLARLETAPRSEALAVQLVEGLGASIGRLHKHPHQSAGFSVLKAPDIPSVLVELGFLSDADDLRNLLSPSWRARAALGIRIALEHWAVEDAAQARLLRK